MVKIFSVTNGAIESGAFLYGNDAMVPAGTYYVVRLVDTNNNLLFQQKWSIQGTNLDLGTLTPTTTGVVLPDPLIKNVTNSQSVIGPVTFSSGVTAFSLTLNGNLNPGAAYSYDLGTSAVPWRNFFAQKTNEQIRMGSAGGTVTPPAASPSVAQESTGSIANGSYCFKFSYVNRNGETTLSPGTDFTVTGGPRKVAVALGGDLNWYTGAYGYRVYTGNGTCALAPTMFRQTPQTISLSLAAAGSSMTGSAAARTNNIVTVTATGSLGTEFQVGRPVVMTGWDSGFNGSFRILSIGGDTPVAGTTKFSFYQSGGNASSTAIGAAQVPAIVRVGNIVYARTAPHSAFTGKSVAVTGVTDTSFNGTFAVREVVDNQTLSWTQTGSDGTSSSGNVSYGTGLDGTTAAHWVTGWSILSNLTFSGTTEPSSNTATIDPIQVAANATYVPSTQTPQGVLVLPTGSTTLTTPLILHNQQKVTGPAKVREGNGGTNNVLKTTWADVELAAVMVIGASSFSMEGFNISSAGHGLMILSTATNHNIQNGSILTTSTSGLYSALRLLTGTGQLFSVYIGDVFMVGDRAVVMTSNMVGTNFRVRGSRWDCNAGLTTQPGSSAFLNDGGADDFDRNTTSVGGGTAWVQLEDLFTESCTGIQFDFRSGIGAHLRNLFTADARPNPGTPAIIRLASDSFSGSHAYNSSLQNVDLESNANYHSAFAVTQNASGLVGPLAMDNVTAGNSLAFNFNSISSGGISAKCSAGNTFLSTYSTASNGRVVNQPATGSLIAYFGCGSNSTSADRFANNNFWGGIRLTPHSNPARERLLVWGSAGNGNNLEYWSGDPATATNRRMTLGDGATVGTTLFDSTGNNALLTIDTNNNLIRLGASSAGSGALGVPNNAFINARNAANNGDRGLIGLDTSNRVQLGDNNSTPYFSSTNTVTVRLCNATASAIDPASQTFAGRVIQ
ncbi:MAG: hypothetical protein HY046_07590 [Acidobacteria bacterium]|nr:hypothetical protein [Acidobacteriota bacterium]